MLDKLSELSDEKLKLTLKDDEVRKELMLDFNHNTFVWLVYTLNDKLPYLIDAFPTVNIISEKSTFPVIIETVGMITSETRELTIFLNKGFSLYNVSKFFSKLFELSR